MTDRKIIYYNLFSYASAMNLIEHISIATLVHLISQLCVCVCKFTEPVCGVQMLPEDDV